MSDRRSLIIRRDAPPRLLVSVVDAAEAADALAGGADVIDVKDPTQGPLGCAGEEVLSSLAGSITQPVPWTAALGEVGDWSERSPIRVPRPFAMVKLGLSGLAGETGWIERWQETRRRFDAVTGNLEWVAVAYADAAAARSPSIERVAAAAMETGCAGLLIDTFDKANGRFSDFVSRETVLPLARHLHAAGLFLAVAGRLELADLSTLAAWPVDVIAVRSAACEQSDRRNRIGRSRVAECRRLIQRER
jgi:uncharacterized protein (UPF0264 family)